MLLIRQSKPEDVPSLVKLAKMVYFINLPPDESAIAAKIAHSSRCFVKAGGGTPTKPPRRRGSATAAGGMAAMDSDSDLFMFSLVEPESGVVIGTSQVRSHQGGPGNPNWSMQLSEKKFFSPKLGQGTTHTVGRLFGDESGPSEIGGLILDPGFRGRRPSPGRFLSFVRFHFVGLHRSLFSDRVIAEMMGPVSSEGESIFWDHVGRKFIPVKFAEADRFCQHNRAFIPELYPRDEIYITLLPLEVQNQVGTVGKETAPARKLLESLGFKNRGFVDPFDGGPHLDARTDEIPLVRGTSRALVGKPIVPEQCHASAMVSTLTKDGDFRAVECPIKLTSSTLRIPSEAMELLGARPGAEVGVTPMDAPETPRSTRGARARAGRA